MKNANICSFELSRARDARIRRSFRYRFNKEYKYLIVSFLKVALHSLPEIFTGIALFATLFLLNIVAHLFH